jgi:hypothetical protein
VQPSPARPRSRLGLGKPLAGLCSLGAGISRGCLGRIGSVLFGHDRLFRQRASLRQPPDISAGSFWTPIVGQCSTPIDTSVSEPVLGPENLNLLPVRRYIPVDQVLLVSRIITHE